MHTYTNLAIPKFNKPIHLHIWWSWQKQLTNNSCSCSSFQHLAWDAAFNPEPWISSRLQKLTICNCQLILDGLKKKSVQELHIIFVFTNLLDTNSSAKIFYRFTNLCHTHWSYVTNCIQYAATSINTAGLCSTSVKSNQNKTFHQLFCVFHSAIWIVLILVSIACHHREDHQRNRTSMHHDLMSCLRYKGEVIPLHYKV